MSCIPMAEHWESNLAAHSTLVNINPENYDKFKSVIEFLQADVNKLDQK